jgi:hypothetical protein
MINHNRDNRYQAASGDLIPDIATRPQLCRYLQVSEKHLRNLEARGVIPSTRLGKLARYNVKAVVAALDAQGKGGS